MRFCFYGYGVTVHDGVSSVFGRDGYLLFFAVAVRKRNRGRIVVIFFAFQRVGGVGIDHITDHLGNIDLIVFAGVAVREFELFLFRVIATAGRISVGNGDAVSNILCCRFQLAQIDGIGIFRRISDIDNLAEFVFCTDRNGTVSFAVQVNITEYAFFLFRKSCTIGYGIAADSHAARDGGVGVMSDDGGVFDVGFRAFIRRAENDASVGFRQFSVVTEKNRAGRVFRFVIRADHGDMGDIFRFIFETVHEVIGAYLILGSREGIIDAHNLRRHGVVRGVAAADYHGRAAGLIVNGHFAEFFDQLVRRSRAAGNAVGKSGNALDRIGHFISRAENQSTVRIFRHIGEADNAVGNACRTAMPLGLGADHRAENTFIKGICTHRGLVDVVAFPIRFGRDIGAAHLAQVGMRADLDTARASIRVGADSDSCRGPLRIVRCAKTQVFFLSSDTIENIRALANRHAAGQSCVRCYPGIVTDRHGT